MTDSIYTDTVTADIVDRYVELRDSGADYNTRTELVNEMANELKVKPASVRAKLTSERVYVAKEKAKTGTAGQTKEQIAAAFGAVIGKNVPSIAKASKTDLETLWNFYKELNDTMEIRIAEAVAAQTSN